MVNIFIFLNLLLYVGPEATTTMRQWHTILEAKTLILYTAVDLLMKQKHVAPIIGWEGAANMIKQWSMILDVILGTQ